MPTPKKPSLDFGGLLTAEFEYIAQTMVEAHEDRARVASFYLVAVGSFVAALFSAQFFNTNLSKILTTLLCILFFLLTLLGTSTIVQLGRFRAAWYASAVAMNKIKNFAMKHHPELEEAFPWKMGSIPKKYKLTSISFLQAIEVSLLSGLMLGSAIFFLQLTKNPSLTPPPWGIAIPAGIIAVGVEIAIYLWSLSWD